MRISAFALALFAIPAASYADDYKLGDLVIERIVARETPKSAMTGAGYLKIMNMGVTADRLMAVEAAYPRVEIHDVKVENDIASMFRIEGVEIGPSESITLQPGQKHVMFMGLDGDPFEAGEEIPATLVFETAGSIEVVFEVKSADDLVEALGIEGGHAGHGSDDESHNHN
ncbi:MAG: copper chaperone PCu(A)C [Pseudomonadota bacterium]